MKYQSFIMRVLCLLLIVGVVLGYNSMQKKDSDTEKDQQIASLTTRVEALEKQQDEILSALEEAAKAQEEAKKKAEEEAKNQKAQTEEAASGDASEDAKKDDKNTDETEAEDASSEEESEDLVYKNGTYTGDGQGFGGNIQVQVTLENDTITDIQVVSAPGEDSAYLSQGQFVIYHFQFEVSFRLFIIQPMKPYETVRSEVYYFCFATFRFTPFEGEYFIFECYFICKPSL